MVILVLLRRCMGQLVLSRERGIVFVVVVCCERGVVVVVGGGGKLCRERGMVLCPVGECVSCAVVQGVLRREIEVVLCGAGLVVSCVCHREIHAAV